VPQLLSVTIQSLVNGGYGFAHLPDGRALFVPFCLPGETVKVRVIQEKKTHAFGQPIEWLRADPTQIEPRCRHFGICGGCHFQHIPPELQLTYKKRIFRDTFEHIAGFDAPSEIPMIPSPQSWNYRNALQFRLSREGRLCFAGWMENTLFQVEDCLLPMPQIDRVWREMDFESSAVERLVMRQNQDGDLMIVLHGKANDVPALETKTTASIVHLDGQEQVVLAGEDHLIMRIGGRCFQVSGGAFFQTNFAVTEALVRAVTELVGSTGSQEVIDLYCGVGLFSAFLADQVKHISAVESSALACDDFFVNLYEYDHIDLYQGKVEQVLPHMHTTLDCAILDPPRAGMNTKAAEALLKLSPAVIIYVSCNAATLARDAKKLTASGYHLESALLLDMFPQTYHVESVSLFMK